MKYLTLSARLLIGGLFIYASVHKIFDPLDFAARNSQLQPPAGVVEQYDGTDPALDRIGGRSFSCHWY